MSELEQRVQKLETVLGSDPTHLVSSAVLEKKKHLTLYSWDLIVNSPLQLLHISMLISNKNLVLDQDNNFYLISLSILITNLLDSVWIY